MSDNKSPDVVTLLTFDDFKSPIGLVMEEGKVNTGVDIFPEFILHGPSLFR